MSHLYISPILNVGLLMTHPEIQGCPNDSSAHGDTIVDCNRPYSLKGALQWISRILVSNSITLQLQSTGGEFTPYLFYHD